MAFSKSLLIKGLAASTAIGGTALTIHQKDNIASLFSKAKKAWGDLECEEKDGSVCSIKQGGKILIKKEENSSPFEITTLGSGTIKINKDTGYEEGFKFVIEDNDIAGVSGENNKLEQFETYEVKLGTDSDGETLKDKYYLFRKTDAKTEIKKALGLPNENCNLPDNGASQDCSITTENIKTFKFNGGTSTVSGTVKLTISKDSSGDYPFGYKFSFSSTSQATLTIGEKAINIKNGSDVDFKIKKSEKGNEISLENAWTAESLAKKVGLKKSDGDYWDIEEGGLKVNRDSHKETGKIKSGTPAGKIKLYNGQWEYNQGFKFSIEDGDIDLAGRASTNISKLEQFETYEIKETDGTWYLTKKGDDLEKIKDLLGLPCNLPTNGTSQECEISAENIKNINFDGGTAAISGNGIKLSISKETNKTEFPLGYKFTFKNTGSSQAATLNIGSKIINIKASGDVDFKIKKTGASLSLENAWTLDFLTKKVGLKKEDDNYWTVGDSGLNVKQDSRKETGKTKNGNPAGKIKVEDDQTYNQGFKFSIENGDVNLNGGNSSITLLSQFESYEIVKESGQWYFSRKKDDRERIKSLLGLPCNLPTTSSSSEECGDISNGKIGNIKFDGAGNSTPTLSGSTLLNIHKESNRLDYPLGYKFTFKSTENPGGSTITLSSETSNSIILKAGTDIDFKIKRSGANNDTLSLEKAWNADALMKKVSFVKEGDDAWVPGDGTMNIDQRNSNKSTSVTKNSSGTNSAKIRSYEGVGGYNQGFKFVVEDGDTDLTGGNGISKLSRYETYEVFEESSGDKWYFRRNLDSSSSIRDILGIHSACSMPTSTSTPTPCTLDADKLKAIKFEGKPDEQATTINGGGSSVTLNISKESNDNDYPLGFKFTFPSSNSHDFTIPQASGSITVDSSSDTFFKIKVGEKSKLTLEKKS